MQSEEPDIHHTARGWFALKLAKGQTPEVWSGGMIDGLEYFVVDLGDPEDDRKYWLTDVGLFDPPKEGQHLG